MEKMTFNIWWEKYGAWRYAEIMVNLPIALSARAIAAAAWERAITEEKIQNDEAIRLSLGTGAPAAPAEAVAIETPAPLETPPAPGAESVYTPAPQ